MPGSSSTAHSTAHNSTASTEKLDRNSTARQLLDAQAHGVSLDRLDRNSTGSTRLDRQGLDSPSTTGSTAPRRSLDSSTARQLDSQGSSAVHHAIVRPRGGSSLAVKRGGCGALGHLCELADTQIYCPQRHKTTLATFCNLTTTPLDHERTTRASHVTNARTWRNPV
jgi:hypothetical protein